MQLSFLWEDNTIGSSEGISATPAMENGRAYLANSLGQVFCITLENGEIIWQFRASSVVDADVVIVNGCVIVCCTNGFIYALDKEDGRVIWSCLTSGGISYTPAVQDGLLYVGTGGKISCIDSNDGSELWTYPSENAIVGGPAISGNHLVFASGIPIRGVYVYCIDLVSRHVMWRQKTFPFHTTSPVISAIDNDRNEKVFIKGFHEIRCMDLITGHVDWAHRSGEEISVNSCVCRFGVIVGKTLRRKVYSLDTRTGNLQWSTSWEGAGFSPHGDSVVFVCPSGWMYCLDGLKGTFQWKRKVSSGNLRMSINDNYLLLFGRGKDVYCYEMGADESAA